MFSISIRPAWRSTRRAALDDRDPGKPPGWEGEITLNDTDSADKKFQKELNSGTAALVLLGVLNRAPEPLYGYRIAKLVEQGGGGLQMMKHGALYPVLRSLESGGFLSSRVEPSVSGPPRRYYGITEAGRKTLHRWTEIWKHTKAFVDNALKGIQDEERH